MTEYERYSAHALAMITLAISLGACRNADASSDTGTAAADVATGSVTPATGNATATGTISTFAGSDRFGYQDGSGEAARFNAPSGLAVDQSGNVYVADYANNRIRKITHSGVVTTLAGGEEGFQDGAGAAARFSGPVAVAVDATGNVYVVDHGNLRIRKITASGIVSTIAGDGNMGGEFLQPAGIAVDASGTIYVVDRGYHQIIRISSSGTADSFAGRPGSAGLGNEDGIGVAAKFYGPAGIAVDLMGDVFVADGSNHRIRKITPAQVVTTIAGSSLGYHDGAGDAAKFDNPSWVAVDASRNVYVTEAGGQNIRKITPAGVVTTLTGSTDPSDARRDEASRLLSFQAIAVDAHGVVYFVDKNRIRKVTQ